MRGLILHDVASPAAASRPPDVRARAAGLQQPYRACLSACGAAWNVTAADPRLLVCALSGRRPGCRKSRFLSFPIAADRQSPCPASFLADLAREIAAPRSSKASSLLALSGSSPARQRAQPGVSCAVCGARVLYSTLNLNYEVLQRSTTRARRAPDTILNASPSRARRAASDRDARPSGAPPLSSVRNTRRLRVSIDPSRTAARERRAG